MVVSAEAREKMGGGVEGKERVLERPEER